MATLATSTLKVIAVFVPLTLGALAMIAAWRGGS